MTTLSLPLSRSRERETDEEGKTCLAGAPPETGLPYDKWNYFAGVVQW